MGLVRYALRMGALRQSKFSRSDTKPLVRIGEYQIDIIDAVYKFRYLTAPHIATVLNRHPDSVKRIVRQLYDAKYLLRPLCQRDPAPWHTSHIYHTISSKGAELLRQEKSYIVPKNGYDEKEAQESIGNWNHDTALAEFLVKLQSDVRKEGCLELLLPWDMLERGIISSTAPWQPYQWAPLQWDTTKGRVVPDAVVMFHDPHRPVGQNHSLLLIELDRGTEAIERFRKEGSSIRAKIEKYVAAYQAGMHTKTYGVRNMRVAFVTTSIQRIQGMISVITGMGADPSKFLFTTIKAAREAPSLLNLVWLNGSGNPTYLTRS